MLLCGRRRVRLGGPHGPGRRPRRFGRTAELRGRAGADDVDGGGGLSAGRVCSRRLPVLPLRHSGVSNVSQFLRAYLHPYFLKLGLGFLHHLPVLCSISNWSTKIPLGNSASLPICHAISAQFSRTQAELGRHRYKPNQSQQNVVSNHNVCQIVL